MKDNVSIIFAHDHIFYKNEQGAVFSSGGLPAIVWDRYLSVFSRITVLARDGGALSELDSAGCALSSHKNVSFSLVKNVSNFKSKVFGNESVNTRIRALVQSHDAIISRLPSELGLLLIKEAIRQKKPYAIELVECPFDALWNYGFVKAKLYAPLSAIQVRSALKRSNFSLYVTKYFLQERYPSPHALTVDCSNVQIDPAESNVIEDRVKNIGKLERPIRIGLIGSLHGKLKGIDTALDALAILDSQNINFTFHVLGQGNPEPFRGKAKSLGIANKVFFEGVLASGTAVLDWLDGIDIYIQPSLREGLPRALIEAMSRGCPAIATSVAGIPELLDAPFLIKRKDSSGLANKILIFILNPEFRKEQALRNFSTSKRYYSDILCQKRYEFWSKFKSYVAQGGDQRIG